MSRYLVSFCNTGSFRLAVVSRQGIDRRIEIPKPPVLGTSLGMTGLASANGKIFVSLQTSPAAVLTLDFDLAVTGLTILRELADLHGIACHGDRLLIASTGTDQICSVEQMDAESVKVMWRDADTLTDSLHLNDLRVVEDRVFVSSFGRRIPGRTRLGSVVDITTGETLAAGLREPHSPFWWRSALYVLDSVSGDLLRFRAGFPSSRVLGIVGYARGLAVDEKGFVVGKSAYRELSGSMSGHGFPAPHIAPMSEVNALGRSGVCFFPHDGGQATFVDTTEIGAESSCQRVRHQRFHVEPAIFRDAKRSSAELTLHCPPVSSG